VNFAEKTFAVDRLRTFAVETFADLGTNAKLSPLKVSFLF